MRKSDKLKKEELDFLPAALEITETPPSPAAHILLWTLLALFTIAVVWACLAHVDEVAIAAGKVIPTGYTKTVQAEDKGTVTRIFVKDGQAVKKGEQLLSLDSTAAAADLARCRKMRAQWRVETMRLKAELEGKPFNISSLKDTGGVDARFLSDQQALHDKRISEYTDKTQSARQAVESSSFAVKTAQAILRKLEMQLPAAREREANVKRALENGGVSSFTYQEYREKLFSLEQDILSQRAEVQRLTHQFEESGKQLDSLRSEWLRDTSSNLVEVGRKIDEIDEEIKKAETVYKYCSVTAPIDGTVQQLSVHTEGAVVQPAQALMLIVPDGSSFAFETWLPNKDIGFVYKGQAAEIKVETFNFQKYGTLEAAVEEVGNEAVSDEERGLIYRVLLTSKKCYFDVKGQKVNIKPGMSVTAEIKTRRKRVIEFFMEPFISYKNESLRER